MAAAFEQVDAVFTKANAYADAAKTAAASFLNKLETSVYSPPTLSVTWATLTPPTLPDLPSTPTLPSIEFNSPGSTPAPLAISEPTVTIDDFGITSPTLNFPTAPTVSYGTTPTVPTVGTVTVPDAPTIPTVEVPTFLELSTVTTPTIDLREDWIDGASAPPTLTLLEPTPYSYARGPEYASTLLTALKGRLADRLAGGSGLPAAVEAAIWGRARDRESRVAQANIDQVLRSSDALGFHLPAGVVAAQLREAEQNFFDKASELSRDVAIKQADLEQSNLKDSIASGIQLEGQLIDYSYKLEALSFESAKAYAENAIQVHNATVEKFRALVAGYQAYVAAYKTIIDGQMAVVEVYKAKLQGEQIKAQINSELVQRYKATIDAGMARVEIYRAQVQGAQTLIQLEQAKISAAGEQIRAYVATVNAETAKVEAYKVGVAAETTKVEAFRANVDAYRAKVGAQADKARADLSRYTALIQAKSAEWDGYRAQVGAEAERIRALGVQSTNLLDGYRAASTAIMSKAEMSSNIWKASMTQYEASQNIAIQTARLNNDATISTNNARMDAAKTGAQIYAQLTSSAYSMIHASAGVSASGGTSVSYSYSNDTTSEVPPLTAV